MSAIHKIFAVDDEELNLDVLEEALSDEFQLELFSSGEECIKACETSAPDLVFLDLMMPGVDGYETCRRLRAMSTLKSTKVIILSAKAETADRIRGYEVGADDYLTKPFDSEELIAKARVFLRLKSVEEVVEARAVGMSEVATGVFHDIANVLNSLNVSLSLAAGAFRSRALDDLGSIVKLLDDNSHDLGAFFSQDRRGTALPCLLNDICSSLKSSQDVVLGEVRELVSNTQHISELIRVQQSSAMTRGTLEEVTITEFVDSALRLNRALVEGVRIEQAHENDLQVLTNKHKVLQILTNLIQNACEAVIECEGESVVTLTSSVGDDGTVKITVIDTGIGLSPEQLSRMFQYGFTTKKSGHGFGLHSSSVAAAELGGSLYAHSGGRGQGAAITLELPLVGIDSASDAA